MDDTKHTASQTDPNLEPRENRSSSLLVRKRLKMLKIYVANGCYEENREGEWKGCESE